MIDDLKKDSEERMNKTLGSLEHGFAKVRTGRAHPSILNGVMVSYVDFPPPLTPDKILILDKSSSKHLNALKFFKINLFAITIPRKFYLLYYVLIMLIL